MVTDENTKPDQLSLKQLFGMLTAGQARAVAVATIGLVGGVFAAGMWVNEIRIAHSYHTRIDSMITKENCDRNVSSLKEEQEKQVATLTADHEKEMIAIRTAKAAIEDKVQQFTLQIEYLERCHAYLNARIKGREDNLNNDSDDDVGGARKQFTLTLRRMYKDGDRTLQKQAGYEFDESEAGNHKVIFGGVKAYRIPADVKGDFIGSL